MSFSTNILRIGLLAAAMAAATAAWAGVPRPAIRVLFNTEPNPPIVYGRGTAIDPERPSLIVDLLRMVGQDTGIAFEFQRVPWPRGLYMIESGQADAIFAASFTPERERYGAFPMKNGQLDEGRRIHQQSYSLFVRQDSALGWNGQAISGLKAPVGASPEFAVVPMLRAMGVALDLEASTLGNLRKLKGGRIDAYAEIDTLAEAAIRTNPGELGGIVKLTPPLRSTPYFLMFSKAFYETYPDVAEQVWNTIATIRASPAYHDLVAGKYAD